ncbi:MAG: MoaD/ThiS family protein [Spirochaetes bacterium]|nr:MoaD/ThiS family protein [Spirochaetota bacterium]
MKIYIKLSASYSAARGIDDFSIDLPENSTVDLLLKKLSEDYSNLNVDRKETMVVINDKIMSRNRILNDGEKATIFHLFAGG